MTTKPEAPCQIGLITIFALLRSYRLAELNLHAYFSRKRGINDLKYPDNEAPSTQTPCQIFLKCKGNQSPLLIPVVMLNFEN